MVNSSDLVLPFFEDSHRQFATDLKVWCQSALAHDATEHAPDDIAGVDRVCCNLVNALGQAGWLAYCVPAPYGIFTTFDVRTLCLARQTLAYHAGLADFAFAMQGLGSGAISLFGSEHLKAEFLPNVVAGTSIAAFALSEPDAGSDVAAMTTSARHDGDSYVLNGRKTWISNGGIADFYTVFARTEAAGSTGSKGISAIVVPANTPGLRIAERISVMAPHPLATLEFADCRIPTKYRLGEEGQGFKIAMQTLDIFRPSVGAAAIGFAQRAMDEAFKHARQRKLFNQVLADFQMTQAALADMATAIDSAALLVYRAAWLHDVKGLLTTKEAAMAKMAATESAQQVIDAAVQMFGGLGVKRGQIVESLYREIRALRIYEGATEVQKLIIARSMLRELKTRGQT